jgi:hypothetical protein
MRSVPYWQAMGQEPPGLAAAGSRVTELNLPVARDRQVHLPRFR